MHEWAEEAATSSPLHFCLEATGVYSLSVAYQLYTYPQTTLSVINPAQIHAYAKAQLRRAKTDRVDAQTILSFAQSQRLPRWQPDSKPLRQLYQLVVHADALRADLRQWANRHHAQKYTPDVPAAVQKTQQAIVRSLTRQLEKIEEAIALLCRTDPELKQQVDLLVTITGIAPLSAVKILAYGGHALTQRTRHELTAHAGLAACHHQSGTSVRGKSHLAKQGNRRLRSALYMPALVGIVHNPVLKQFYQQLLTMDKPKMVALVACMRKLLLIVRSVLVHKKPFTPQLLPLT
jgi:transposase